MSKKKRVRQSASRAAKRGRFTTKPEKTSGGASPAVLIGGIVVAVAIMAVAVLAFTRRPLDTTALSPSVSAATSGHEPYPPATAENGAVRLSAATFDDYKAHYYTYMQGDQPIEFFVLKSSDGVVRAAFNACDVCFQSQRGYSQDGDEVICNNCGLHFPADQINVVRGGCNPSPLDRTLDGDTLVIQVEDIVSGLGYF
jgi:uncharacterized membrane protein